MTYEDLEQYIRNMTPEQRQQTVTVFVQGVGEYYSVSMTALTTADDVLDKDHPYLVI